MKSGKPDRPVLRSVGYIGGAPGSTVRAATPDDKVDGKTGTKGKSRGFRTIAPSAAPTPLDGGPGKPGRRGNGPKD